MGTQGMFAGVGASGLQLAGFTLLACLAAGMMLVTGILQVRREASRLSVGMGVASAVLAIVGVALFVLTLGNPASFFGGFRHATTGITLLLYASLLFVAASVVGAVLASRDEDGDAPAWMGAVTVVASVLFVGGVALGFLKTTLAQLNWGVAALFLLFLAGACTLGGLATLVVVGVMGGAGADDAGTDGAGGELAAAGALARRIVLPGAIVTVAAAALLLGWFATSEHSAVARGAAKAAYSMQGFASTGATGASSAAAATLLSSVVTRHGLLFWGGAVVLGMVVPLLAGVCLSLRSVAAGRGRVLAIAGIGLACALVGGYFVRIVIALLM